MLSLPTCVKKCLETGRKYWQSAGRGYIEVHGR
jgi:hypothetical protein